MQPGPRPSPPWTPVVILSAASLACPTQLVPHAAGDTTSDTTSDTGEPDTSPPVPTSGDPVSTTSTTDPDTGDIGTRATGDASNPGTTGAASTTEDTSDTTSLPPGTCGDGVLDPQETCDDGYSTNQDDGECKKNCQLAYCGDGLIWAGKEICDAGPANNDNTYNGCRENCTPGPACNDGVLQMEEECDASAPDRQGEVECDPGNCRFKARVAFVTSESFPGDLGGLAGADAICVAAAGAAGLDNASHFLAYLSDGAASPTTRFVNGAKAKGYPYARRDGQKLAEDLDDLFYSGLQIPLEITELGTPLPPSQVPPYAWTGTGIHGEPYGNHCANWSTKYFEYSGGAGRISPISDSQADLFTWKINAQWVQFISRKCDWKQHLYCFED